MTKRKEPAAPLPASARTSDADYSGVVGSLGPDWRLSVTMAGDGYLLQQRVPAAGGPTWVQAGGRSPKTLAKIVAKYGGQVDGLAALCARLPVRPGAAAPRHVAAVGAQRSAFAARDMGRADYARVVARDSQLRLAVCPDAAAYCLQWAKNSEQDAAGTRWRELARSPVLADLREWVHAKVGSIMGPGPGGVLRGDDVLPRWDAMVSGLPERADAGVWPRVPSYPGGSARSASDSAQRSEGA